MPGQKAAEYYAEDINVGGFVITILMLVLCLLGFAFMLTMGILTIFLAHERFIRAFDRPSCYLMAGNLLCMSIYLIVTLSVKRFYASPNRLAVQRNF